MQCIYIKDDGKQCGAKAIKQDQYCFNHNPDYIQQKQSAVLKGGFASKRVELGLEPVEIKNPQHVVSLLESTINGVRSGKIPPNIANTVGYLAGHLLKALEVSNLDQRLELVESVLIERKTSIKKGRQNVWFRPS